MKIGLKREAGLIFTGLVMVGLSGCGNWSTEVSGEEVEAFEESNRWTETYDSEFDEETARYEAHFAHRRLDLANHHEPVIAPWTKVVERDLLEDLEEVHENRLVFRRGHQLLEDLSRMDLIVSGHEEAPFLRRVVEIERSEEQVRIETRQAEITDAMLHGSFSLTGNRSIDPGEDLREVTLAVETGTFEQEEPRWAPEVEAEGEISFALEVSYPTNPPGYRAIFDLAVTLGDSGWSIFGFNTPKREFCQDYMEAEKSRDSLDLLTWYMYWGGKQLRDSWTCSYRCCLGISSCGDDYGIMRATFYDSSRAFASWVRDQGLYGTYDLNYTDLNNYPRRRIRAHTRTNRNRVLTELRGRRNRASNRIRYDALIDELEAIPGDLHWIDMAPEFAKKFCTGTTVEMQVGGGPEIDFEIQPVVRANYNQTITFLDEKKWERRILKKPITFFIGWLPVYMQLDVNWKTTASAKLESGFNFTLALPAKRTTIDFYHGVVYPPHDQNRSCSRDAQCPTGGLCVQGRCKQFFETLSDLTNGARSNTINILGPASTPERNRFSVTVESTVKGEADMTTGPNLMVSLYDTVGLGVALEATGEAFFNVQGSNKAPAECKSRGEVGVRLQGLGQIQIPLCPLDECKKSGAITMFNSCDSRWSEYFWMCPKFDIDSCPSPQNMGTTRRGSTTTGSQNMTSVSNPPGANDVQGAYELDALFIQRGQRRILPVEVQGLMPGQCTSERGTVERGCPELLWEADFTECDPDGWADKVALIPDFDNFYVRFKENLQDGDILHVIRQAVPANEMNEEGLNCAASGTANFSIGVLAADGSVMIGSPVATDVYNSNSYRINVENFQTSEVGGDEPQGWNYYGDDDGYGDWEPPQD